MAIFAEDPRRNGQLPPLPGTPFVQVGGEGSGQPVIPVPPKVQLPEPPRLPPLLGPNAKVLGEILSDPPRLKSHKKT